jgi:hypothetical protein
MKEGRVASEQQQRTREKESRPDSSITMAGENVCLVCQTIPIGLSDRYLYRYHQSLLPQMRCIESESEK